MHTEVQQPHEGHVEGFTEAVMLEPDDTTGSDADSAIGDDAASETTSIASSVREFRIENGRRYHALRDGAYWGPNDDAAQDHIDLAHALFTKTFGGKLFLAPIPPNTGEVLDVGTGTGIWATDFADENPSATIIGIDLSPIQPEWVPPNCKFEVDDAEQEWTFGENRFDYIHIRTLYGGISDWSRLYKQCMRSLKPGGWLEQAEYSPRMVSEDGTLTDDSPLAQCGRLGAECYAALNRPLGELNIYETMEKRFRDEGFEDVTLHQFKWPLGRWPKDPRMKELGLWAAAHMDLGLENYTMRLLTTCLGWTAEEVYALCAGVRRQMKDQKVHAIHLMNVVYGRKPEMKH